jgi:hypothetical protein
MGSDRHTISFSEEYGRLRALRAGAREGPVPAIPENVLQCIWYDRLLAEGDLRVADGRRLQVLSPGWWNHGEGPDFKGAQIELDDVPYMGDVEVHLDHGAWIHHGHQLDARYNDVVLVVALEAAAPACAPVTAAGKRLPVLLLPHYLEEDVHGLADRLAVDDYPYLASNAAGKCSAFVQSYGVKDLARILKLAGDWRVLSKARALRERMEKAGTEQAVYEAFLSACGYSHFKHHFAAIARHLPYDRVRQLARQDALLLETAFLQIAGLLPEALPPGTSAVAHFARLRALRRDRLAGLKSLPLVWRRVGVRPNNNPERRLAGAAHFLSRTAGAGLLAALESIWTEDLRAVERRRAFEGLFPPALGFWASHCTWTGKTLRNPAASLGAGRIRSIIGNVFVPAALAIARRDKDRRREETILEFLSVLPKEPENQVLKIMVPRVLGPAAGRDLDFRMQQGLLQLHQDWCASNPSCQDCAVMQFLTPGQPYG